jgi:hypothetical protein
VEVAYAVVETLYAALVKAASAKVEIIEDFILKFGEGIGKDEVSY